MNHVALDTIEKTWLFHGRRNFSTHYTIDIINLYTLVSVSDCQQDMTVRQSAFLEFDDIKVSNNLSKYLFFHKVIHHLGEFQMKYTRNQIGRSCAC
jgi:hypothetical protein